MRIPTEQLVERYQQNLYSAAFSVCRNAGDAEDAVQDTFLRYHTSSKEFENEQHIRYWLLRVAINQAKNTAQSFWRRNAQPLEDYLDSLAYRQPEDRGILGAVMALPEKYRIVIHLYYYEDYDVRDIGRILHVTSSAVKTRLSRGRRLLKDALQEEWNDDE